MPTWQEIERNLCGPGAPFELAEEPVLGTRMPVFRERHPHLRALLEQSALHGQAEYLVSGDRRIGFAEHERVVSSVAAALRQRFDVRKGDRVALLASNRPEWIVAFWAAVSLGAVPVGLNGWWVRDEIVHALASARPKLLIGDAHRLSRLRGSDVAAPVVEMESEFDALWNHDLRAPLPDVPLHEDDPAAILYTSGTTGPAKGAVHTHRNVIAFCRLQMWHGARLLAMNAARGGNGHPLAAKNCALVTTPLFHVSGLYAGAVTLLAAGVKTVWTEGRFEAGEVLEIIERERVTNWGPMGAMIHRVVHHADAGRRDLTSLRHLGTGGAPLHPGLHQRIRTVFPNARGSLSVAYGLTEATALATLNFGDELEVHPESVGRPLPSVAIDVRGEDGAALAEGEEGEIHLRGPLVMKEYWSDLDATRRAVLPRRWLRTGDFGRLESGRLYLSPRRRDRILRGGENVQPDEIERCLEAHPGVWEAAVVGVDHPELGQEVKAVVVPAEGADLDRDQLRGWVAARLAYFKVPAHWELRDRPLPRTASGKVMKHVLRGEAESPFVDS